MNFSKIKQINDNKIQNLNNMIKENADDEELLRKFEIHTKIKDLLEKDETFFFNITYEEAVKILSYIVEKDKIDVIYQELTSAQEFKRLKRSFKI